VGAKPDWVVKQEKAAKAGLSKDMTYYIVEVAYSKENPIHRVVGFHRHIGDLILFTAGYTEVININYTELYHFEVIEELKSMNEKLEVRLPEPKRYIYSKSVFIGSGFHFEREGKVEVIGEELDAYLFVDHQGRNNQISKQYLAEHVELSLVSENGRVIE
jgi:hypothetical protein